jgi:CBS domain-containing protein
MSRNVMTVNENAGLRSVIRLLVENRITGLPVVDDDMRLLGMVTEKDVLKTLYQGDVKSKTVAGLMTPDVFCLDEDDSLMMVFECLVENNFRRIPIMSEGRLTGIVSRADVIRFLFEKLKRQESPDADA